MWHLLLLPHCHNISSLFRLLEDSPFVSFDRFFHMSFPTYLIMCSYHFVHTRTSFSRCFASRSVDNLAVHPLQSLSVAFIPRSLRSLSHLLRRGPSTLTHQLILTTSTQLAQRSLLISPEVHHFDFFSPYVTNMQTSYSDYSSLQRDPCHKRGILS